VSVLLAAGDPASALGAAMAQQQFHTVLDSMSYDELYEYFGGMFSFRVTTAILSVLRWQQTAIISAQKQNPVKTASESLVLRFHLDFTL